MGLGSQKERLEEQVKTSKWGVGAGPEEEEKLGQLEGASGADVLRQGLLVFSGVAQLVRQAHKSEGSIDSALKHWGPQQEHALGTVTFQKDLGGYSVRRRTGRGES